MRAPPLTHSGLGEHPVVFNEQGTPELLVELTVKGQLAAGRTNRKGLTSCDLLPH